MSLFQLGDFKLASGVSSPFKIECDELTFADWECLAYLASRIVSPFGKVIGVPRGGWKFASSLERYVTSGPTLIADDVFTTGGSAQKFMAENPGADAAVVAFSRGELPPWCRAVFTLSC